MKNARGFTLLEMLIALTIFGMGTALLLQSTWSGTWAAQQSWAEMSALRLAQSMAIAGEALSLPKATPSRPDLAIDSLPYRVLRDRRVGTEGGVTYRVEVRTQNDQPLAVVTTRSITESWM